MRNIRQIIKNLEMCNYREDIIKVLANIDDVVDGIGNYNSMIMRGSTLEVWRRSLKKTTSLLEEVAGIKEK